MLRGTKGLISVILSSLCFSIAQAELLFTGDFETGHTQAPAIANNGWVEYKCCVHSLVWGTSLVRAGKYALRAEIRKDDLLGANGAPGRHRSQVTRLRGSGGEFELGKEYWVGLSLYFSDEYTFDQDDPTELLDWHHRPDAGESSSPTPLSVVARGNQLRIRQAWEQHEGFLWQGPLDKGRWLDFVFHVKFSHQADGLVEVWKNGQQIVSKRGVNYYNDQAGPYFKAGLHKWQWHSPIQRQVVYYDEVRIGDAAAGYAGVAPGR